MTKRERSFFGTHIKKNMYENKRCNEIQYNERLLFKFSLYYFMMLTFQDMRIINMSIIQYDTASPSCFIFRCHIEISLSLFFWIMENSIYMEISVHWDINIFILIFFVALKNEYLTFMAGLLFFLKKFFLFS